MLLSYSAKHKTTACGLITRFCFLSLTIPLLYACNTAIETTINNNSQSTGVQLSASNLTTDNLPIDEQILQGQLENGLAYIIRKNGKPENFAELRLVVKTGSIFEDDTQLGFAHFAEHMAFNGTVDFKEQEIVDFVESIGMRFGAHLNASTSFDNTIYKLRVPTNDPKTIETAIHILENWAHKVNFEANAIDEERGVVLEEWRGRKGVGERIAKQQWPLTFAGSNYAERLPIGTEENISHGKHEDLIRFYNTWYRPDLMSIVAVGDFDTARLESLIKKYFSGLQNPSTPVHKETQYLSKFEHAKINIFTDKELNNITLSSTWRTQIEPGKFTKEKYRQKVVQTLLIGILSKRLNDKSLDTNSAFISARIGLSNSIPSSQEFSFRASAKPNQTEKAFKSLLTEIKRAVDHGVSAQELSTEKRLYIEWFESVLESQNTFDHNAYVGSYVNHFVSQSPLSSLDQEFKLTKEYLAEITQADLLAQMQAWAGHENALVFITGPDNLSEQIPTIAELTSVWNEAQKLSTKAHIDKTQVSALMTNVPKSGSVKSKRYIDKWQAHEWVLSNGVKVIIKPTDFKENSIQFKAISDGGYALVSDDIYLQSFGMMNSLSFLGLGELNMEQLSQFSREKRFSVSPAVSEYSEGMNGASNKEDLLYMMQSIYLRFTAPVKDQERFEWMKSNYRPRLENKYNSPNAQFYAAIQEKTKGGNPRNVEFNVDVLDQQNLDVIYKLYKERFANAADFTFVFIGDVDLMEMENLISTYLATLPTNKLKESRKKLPKYSLNGNYQVHMEKGSEPKATVILSLFGESSWSAKNQLLTGAFRSALEKRLRTRLREELGGVYSVRVNASLQRWPYQDYSLSVSFTCDPQRIDELHKEVQAVFNDFAEGKIDPQLLENYKTQTLTARQKNLKENSFWLNYMVLQYTPFVPLPIEKFEPLLNSLDMDMLKKISAQYLRTNNKLFATLKPELSSDITTKTVFEDID